MFKFPPFKPLQTNGFIWILISNVNFQHHRSIFNFQIARWWTRYCMRRLDDLFCELVRMTFFCGAIWTNCNHPDSFNGGQFITLIKKHILRLKLYWQKSYVTIPVPLEGWAWEWNLVWQVAIQPEKGSHSGSPGRFQNISYEFVCSPPNVLE